MSRLPRAAVCSLALAAEPRLLAALTLATGLAAFAPMAFGQNATPPEPRPDAAAEQPADAAAPADAAGQSADATPAEAPAGDAPMAEITVPGVEGDTVGATIRDTEGRTVGSVAIRDTASGAMLVHLTVMDMEPGVRAVHIHETGNCEGDFSGAGGHLAGGREHGVLTAGGYHAGDLPNIIVAETGRFESEFFAHGITLADVMDDDGGALVIHSDKDDYQSQPSGDAGDRIACGVFGPPA
ncbi:superoxide dismutase family protein [Paracoccus sp. S-4012]|uniref:superoxide dismutase family protein n=1 Tax=Paracoccus sp. S-4012 TaxID=2665648 RepID=UPI0012AF8165|nr:superoxide dismutase family protein [Paracoccus sp. S-4012]MRX51560.1 superoxide dismutase family protein [Paracoccus sp. S-4012]